MVLIELKVHPSKDWPAEMKDDWNDPWAYTVFNQESQAHEVHVREVVRVSAVQHELWHILEGLGNRHHHPWWHFCVASYNPIRLDRHGGKATRADARSLSKYRRVNL